MLGPRRQFGPAVGSEAQWASACAACQNAKSDHSGEHHAPNGDDSGRASARFGSGYLMAPITTSIEVARSPEQVFAYVTDPSTMHEWQQGCVSGQLDTPTARVGSKCTTIRAIGGREREVTTTITECDPPRRWADRGIDGPIRAIVAVTVEPLADGSRSRLTIELDFTGHGIGKLLVPLVVRRQAAREMPENMRRLEQRLELNR